MYYNPFQNNYSQIISLDETLKFIYALDGFEIVSTKKTQYIMHWEWFEFKSEKDLDLFQLFIKLHLESIISLSLKQVWNDNLINNPSLKKELDKYIKKDERNIILRIFFKLQKEYDFELIYENWENISQLIKKHDGFDISLWVNGIYFFDLFFINITQYKWYDDLNKNKIINELFENISKKINWEINYSKQIEIFYEFDNYLENNRVIFPLLKELEENKNLVISKVILKENYIHFYLEKFIDFKKEVLLEVSKKIIKKEIIKVEYKNKIIKINNDEIEFLKDKHWIYKESKIYNLYKIIFDSFDYYKKFKVSFEELQTIFDLNIYNELKKEYFTWMNYDNFIRKDLQTKNKLIKEKFNIETFIGIDKNWIWCQYYNSEKS